MPIFYKFLSLQIGSFKTIPETVARVAIAISPMIEAIRITINLFEWQNICQKKWSVNL